MEEIYKNLNKTMLDKIDRIVNKYGYQSHKALICEYLNREIEVDWSTINMHDYYRKDLEIAYLIEFLRNSVGKEIILTSGKGKFKRKITIKNEINVSYLFLWANNWLHKKNSCYEETFKWGKKEKLKHKNEEGVDIISEYNEPYTREEMEKIIQYEKKNINEKPYYSHNMIIGVKASCFQYKFCNEEMFQNGEKMLKNYGYKGEGISEELAFIYDCLVVLKDIIPGDDYDIDETSTHEKYTYIKYCMIAEENAYNSIDKKLDNV